MLNLTRLLRLAASKGRFEKSNQTKRNAVNRILKSEFYLNPHSIACSGGLRQPVFRGDIGC
jgi:hypothetical protein